MERSNLFHLVSQIQNVSLSGTQNQSKAQISQASIFIKTTNVVHETVFQVALMTLVHSSFSPWPTEATLNSNDETPQLNKRTDCINTYTNPFFKQLTSDWGEHRDTCQVSSDSRIGILYFSSAFTFPLCPATSMLKMVHFFVQTRYSSSIFSWPITFGPENEIWCPAHLNNIVSLCWWNI